MGGANCVKEKASVVFERGADVTGLKAPWRGPEVTVTGALRPSPNPRKAVLPSASKAVPGTLTSEAPVVGTSDTRRERARRGLAGLVPCVSLLSGVCGGVMSSYCGSGAGAGTASLSCTALAFEALLACWVMVDWLFRMGVEKVCGPKDSNSECPLAVVKEDRGELP